METVSPSAQDNNSGTNPSSVKSDDSSPRHEGGRGSPPPNCAICLGTCRNKSFTDSCLHQFCFKCLLTWSKVKAECPLCKQNFRSIIHNVQSNHQYEEYMVEQHHVETNDRLDIDALTATTRRFRYRTTLTLPRQLALSQLLVQYPLVAGMLPPAPPPAARRRLSLPSFRRTVYRHNLWARPLPDFTGRYRDCTPEFYRFNDSQMHRLVPWLTRELHYLLNENVGHTSYVLAKILELLPQYHIRSPEFREAMHRYFGDRTDHFLHELYCFASTPYDMTGYDRNVQYTTDTRLSATVDEVISSSDSDSSVDSDIVMVSHSEPAEPPPGPSRAPAPAYPHHYIPPPIDNVIPIETISHSDTDDDDSEVMVVGYIKPPQDRTPEVVDLLGSDSDVIVQDAEPRQGPSRQDGTPPLPAATRLAQLQACNLVRLSVKRQRTPERRDSDSDSGSYRVRAPRRKRPARARGAASSAATCRSTPSPPSSWTPTPSPSPPPTPSPSPSPPPTVSSPSITDSSEAASSVSSSPRRRKRHSDKRTKRKSRKETKTKRKPKKRSRSRSHQRDRRARNSSADDKDRRSKLKSRHGKGVKSSRRSEEASGSGVRSTETNGSEPERASTSGVPAPRPATSAQQEREARRLRSVVNVMYSSKNPYDSSASGCSGSNASLCGSAADENRELNDTSAATSNAPDMSYRSGEVKTKCSNSDTDSEDNLPLNLAMYRSY